MNRNGRRPRAQNVARYRKLSERKINPAHKTKRERRLRRLSRRLAKTRVTTDASKLIRRMGGLVVSVAHEKRRRRRRKARELLPAIMLKSRHRKRPRVLWYDGAKRFRSKRDRAATFATRKQAKDVAQQLIAKYPKLNHWDVYVHGGK